MLRRPAADPFRAATSVRAIDFQACSAVYADILFFLLYKMLGHKVKQKPRAVGASIIPFCREPRQGLIYFILGREKRQGRWADSNTMVLAPGQLSK